MKVLKVVWLIYFLASLLLICEASTDDTDPASEADSDGLEDISDIDLIVHPDTDDGIVQGNPDYVEPPLTGGDSEDPTDTEMTAEGLDEEPPEEGKSKSVGTKKALGKALNKTSNNNKIRALRMLKKHALRILLMATLIAFHREIISFFFFILSTPYIDRETGQIHRRILIDPIAILKVLVLIYLIRRMQTIGGDDNKISPVAALLLTGNKNPFLGGLLANLLASSNPTYVPPIEQHYTFERINERYTKDSMAFKKALTPLDGLGRPLTPPLKAEKSPKASLASLRAALAVGSPPRPEYNGTVVLMNAGSVNGNELEVLQDKVSFLINHHRSLSSEPLSSSVPEMEVVLLLESPGGGVQEFGLAAQQLLRLRREPGIKVTVCVDKVAASGGYMMACASSPGRLFAAPFAMVGSIGVIGQAVNIQKVLEGWGVQPLVFRGGKHKAPVGLLGKVTKDGNAKVQQMVDETHRAFKHHVATCRPLLADRIDDIATGDVWLGLHALEHGLVDRIVTSNEYIGERVREGARLLRIIPHTRHRFLFHGPSGQTLKSTGMGAAAARALQAFVSEFRSSLRMPSVAD